MTHSALANGQGNVLEHVLAHSPFPCPRPNSGGGRRKSCSRSSILVQSYLHCRMPSLDGGGGMHCHGGSVLVRSLLPCQMTNSEGGRGTHQNTLEEKWESGECWEGGDGRGKSLGEAWDSTNSCANMWWRTQPLTMLVGTQDQLPWGVLMFP